ncbi:MAG: hypothetical protein ACOC3C_08005 [Candidatus Thorarchaeota archaeon]
MNALDQKKVIYEFAILGNAGGHEMICIIGYVLLAASWLLILSIMLDRYWDTSLLRGIVTPAESFIFEGRSWWIRYPFRYLLLDIPMPIILCACLPCNYGHN